MLLPPDKLEKEKRLPQVPQPSQSSSSAHSASPHSMQAEPMATREGANLNRSTTSATLPPPYELQAPPPLPRRRIASSETQVATLSSRSESLPSTHQTSVSGDWRDEKAIYSSFAPDVSTTDLETSPRTSSDNGRGVAIPPKPAGSPASVEPSSSKPGTPFAPVPTDVSSSKKKRQEKNIDGLPACFARQPPYDLVASSFQPMFLTPTKNRLREGFPTFPPPATIRPHPFVTHDVREADWTRFMAELKKAASLSAGQITKGIILPYTVWIPGATDYLSYRLRHGMYAENEVTVAAIVDLWNHHFFRPRSLNAILMKGRERLSGKLDDLVKDLHLTPGPDSDSKIRIEKVDSSEKDKSKQPKEDTTIRLFIVPLAV